MLLFVQVHLFASICIAIKYGIDQVYGIAIGGIVVGLIVAEGILFIIKPKNFGDYKKFFYNQNHKHNFYIIVLLFRFILTAGITALSQTITGLCIGIGVLSLEIIILIIFKPYKANLRPILNAGVVVLTLAVYLSYKIKIID